FQAHDEKNAAAFFITRLLESMLDALKRLRRSEDRDRLRLSGWECHHYMTAN
ncbi:hypothetical protein CHS0354_032193, partial [Potamilus streckersoni]